LSAFEQNLKDQQEAEERKKAEKKSAPVIKKIDNSALNNMLAAQ